MQTLSYLSAAWIVVRGSGFRPTGCMERGVEYGPTNSGSTIENTLASYDTDGPWQDCEHICEGDPDCNYFTWTGPSCSLYKEERDKHWPKSIVHRVAVLNEGDCARVCGMDPECNAGFTYHKQTCTTKRSNTPRVVGKTWFDVISGPVDCPEGYPITVPAGTPPTSPEAIMAGVLPAPVTPESESNCPPNYTEGREFCYRVSYERLTQPEANDECKTVAGGSLAMPKTKAQNLDLLSLFCSKYPQDVGQGPFKLETTGEKRRRAKELREDRQDRILEIEMYLSRMEMEGAEGEEGEEGEEGAEGEEGEEGEEKRLLMDELKKLLEAEDKPIESTYECEVPRGAGLDGPYFIGLTAQGDPGVNLDLGKWRWSDGDWLIPDGFSADSAFHRWAGQANNTPIYYGGYPTVQPDNTSKKQYCAYFYPRNSDGSPSANWGDEDCEHKCLYPAQDARGPMKTCYTKGSEGYAVAGEEGAEAFREGGLVGKLTPTPRRYICQAPKKGEHGVRPQEETVQDQDEEPTSPLTADIFEKQCSFVGVYLDTKDLHVLTEVKSIMTCQKACQSQDECLGYSFMFFPKRSDRLSTAANRRAGVGYCYLKASLDRPTLTANYDVISASKDCKLK